MTFPLIQLPDILAARERIAGRVHRTPMLSATSLGAMTGSRLFLKAELFQKTGSFKVRGVINKLSTLSREELASGLISLSAGNHAAALAWGASASGAHATIVMPARAVQSKVDATRAYGGEVVQTERPLLEVCNELQSARGLTMVHPFDDPVVIAGAGTLGLEILEDVPDAAVVLVPIGGGGLIGGASAALKGLKPGIRVIGVEPTGSDVMTQSLRAGQPARMAQSNTIADGLAAPFAGQYTFEQVRRFVDDIVLVDDDAILRALRLLMERAKLVPEPAGAATFAALISGAVRLPAGTTTVCVVSGGNIDPALLRKIWQ